MRSLLGRPLLVGVVVAALVTVVVAVGRWGHGHDPLSSLERRSLDARFRLRGAIAPTGDVVVVTIDDETLRRFPSLLQRRTGLASLLRAIAAARPSVIGFDGFFAEPEEVLPPALHRDVEAWLAMPGHDVDNDGEQPDAPVSLLRRVDAVQHGDDVLAETIAGSRPFVLALQPTGDVDDVVEAAVLRKAKYAQVVEGPVPPPGVGGLLGSLPSMMRGASALGLVAIELDDDQIIRRVVAARSHQGAVLMPMALQIAAAHRRVSPAALAFLVDEDPLDPGGVDGRASVVGLGDTRIPLVRDALLLNHRGGPEVFTTISAARLMERDVDGDVDGVEDVRAALAGKAVLIGFSYLSHDLVATPFSVAQPGVYVHATAVDNLLAGDPLQRSRALADVVVVLVLGLLGAVLIALPGAALPRLGGVVAVAAVVVVVDLQAFAAGWWWPLAGPLMGLGLASLSTFTVRALLDGRDRWRLRQAFSRYLAKELVDELVAHPERLALGGEKRAATVLFSDIRGFTSFSEVMSAEALTRFLNTYLTPMTTAVLSERGFVDKYIGDAIMAVFGAPAPTTDHATRALRAVVKMHQALLTLRPQVQASLPADTVLDCGVGLNSGDVVAGNMGSNERFDYTVVGDTVNLASRLEGQTKRYGVFCLCGEETRRQATTSMRFRSLDLVRVKGRHTPTELFEFLGDEDHTIARYEDLDGWEAAVVAWRDRRRDDARKGFTAFQQQNPQDKVAAMMLARLEAAGGIDVDDLDVVASLTEK